MREQAVKQIIDIYLKKWQEIGLNQTPEKIHPAMADPDQDMDDEWRFWFPIDSRVSAAELEEIEAKIGYRLPDDYKAFLKYKHFYELHISEASFCGHPVDTWKARLETMIFNEYPTEYLIGKGYIPFACWSDWGLLCFDTSRNQSDKNYPVVLWDHEMADDIQEGYKDFFDLITRLDEEDRKNSS